MHAHFEKCVKTNSVLNERVRTILTIWLYIFCYDLMQTQVKQTMADQWQISAARKLHIFTWIFQLQAHAKSYFGIAIAESMREKRKKIRSAVKNEEGKQRRMRKLLVFVSSLFS